MAAVPSVQLPNGYVDAAARLASMSEDLYQSLLSLLSQQRERVNRHGIVEALTSTGLEVEVGTALLSMLVDLRVAAETYGQPKAQGEFQALAQGVSLAQNLAEDTDRESLARRLAELLATTSVNLIARATDLLSEHEHVLAEVRLITDIRPLFDSERAEEVEGAVIAHVLRLRLIGREPLVLHIGVDRGDLVNLRKAINRAFDKEDRLRSAVPGMGVPLVVPYDGQES